MLDHIGNWICSDRNSLSFVACVVLAAVLAVMARKEQGDV